MLLLAASAPRADLGSSGTREFIKVLRLLEHASVDELPRTASPQYPNFSVAMANFGANANGSQFFIVDGTQGQTLAPNYTLFGTVTSGISVVDKINADGNATASANGVPPSVLHRIVSVTVADS